MRTGALFELAALLDGVEHGSHGVGRHARRRELCRAVAITLARPRRLEGPHALDRVPMQPVVGVSECDGRQ